jgi:hypothetical protein
MSPEPPPYFARVFADEGQPAAALVEAYRAGPGLIRRTISGMEAEALSARPIAGKMSSIEVIGHVADSDQFLADRIKRVIATDNPLLIGVDGGAYLGALGYARRDVALQLDLLEVTRAQLAADLDVVPEEAWSRTGVHSEVGVLNVRQLLLHAIRHLELHAATIAEKRAALDALAGQEPPA